MDFYKSLGIFMAFALSHVLGRSTMGSTPNSSTQPPPVSTPSVGKFSNENETEISSGEVFVRVLGQSGKILMGRNRNPSEDPNGLKVTFDAISELDQAGTVIGNGGRVKHSFNTFASQTFTFSNITDDQYQNLSAKRLDFVANITSVGAILTVQMYLFEEEGNITQGDEVSQVSKGTLKFNIVIENWSFCGSSVETCKQGQSADLGEYLEFVISIKGKRAGEMKTGGRRKRTNAQEYDMGGEATVVLSGKARYDGSSTYENLPAGFPKMETQGSSQSFIFRFRKFNSSVFYDPQLDLGSNNTIGESTTEPPTTENGSIVESTTEPPTTDKGTTVESTTEPPTTDKGTTVESTTEPLTTDKGTTVESTTEPPTTDKGTTVNTTEPFTTDKGTTVESTTEPQTTEVIGSPPNSSPLPPPVSTSPASYFSDGNGTEISSAGVFVRVLGQSGKILMGRTRNPSEDPNGLKVTFDAISELDQAGTVIGKGGRVKHSFNTFASQTFTFSNITDDQYQNLSAKRLDFVANIASVGAILSVQMYLFEKEGNITQGDEVSQVSKGTLKFNIVIKNWSFCGSVGETCKQGQNADLGEYIDFVISIKGKRAGEMKTGGRRTRTNAQEYDMGGEATVVLSGKARYDGSSTYENLPAGFPKMETQGSSQSFIFRFRKFNSSVFYDPQLDLGSNNTTEESTTEPPTTENGSTVESTTEPPTTDKGTTVESTTEPKTTEVIGSTPNSSPLPPPVSTSPAGDFSDENGTKISSGGVFVRVLGQSGKILMGRNRNPSEDPNGLKVTFNAISELDKAGTVIGNGGRVKHSFNTFASQTFTFSNITDDQYQNLSAKRLDFVANITSVGAILTVQMYLFEEEGNITQGDEVSQVSKGTLKFNIVIKNWSFCGSVGEICKQGQSADLGEYIDFVISIKGKKAGEMKTGGRRKRTNAQEYDMGGEATVVLSGKARYDGSSTYENLPAGFPKMEIQGSSQFFIFRFRKFNSSVFYDPQLDLGINDTIGESTTAPPTTDKGTTVESTTESSITDTNLQAGGINAKIQGHSGKMTIGRGINANSDGDKVEVTFDEIKEIDSSGAPIGTSGASKHSFNTFANLDFNFSSIRDDSLGGFSAKRIDFSANIASVSALLTVNVYIFTQKGEINIDGEKSSVEIGSVKFNIQLEGWDFCGYLGVTCLKGNMNEMGNGIEFVITIKGKGPAEKRLDNDRNKMTDGDEYKLGGTAALLLSKKIRVDGGNYTDMTSGYPKLEISGSKQSFVFRFPKFTKSVLYDPQILFSVTDTSGFNVVTSSLSLLITCWTVLVIFRVFH